LFDGIVGKPGASSLMRAC